MILSSVNAMFLKKPRDEMNYTNLNAPYLKSKLGTGGCSLPDFSTIIRHAYELSFRCSNDYTNCSHTREYPEVSGLIR
jgi:hypothetical protein